MLQCCLLIVWSWQWPAEGGTCRLPPSDSPVGEGWKTLTVAIVFHLFSTIQGKTVARNFCNFSSEALQPPKSRPCARPAHVAESGPLAGLQVLKNSGSQMFMLRVKILSV